MPSADKQRSRTKLQPDYFESLAKDLSLKLRDFHERQQRLHEWTLEDVASYVGLSEETLTKMRDPQKCLTVSEDTLLQIDKALKRQHLFQNFSHVCRDLIRKASWHYFHLTNVERTRSAWRYQSMSFGEQEGVFVAEFTSKGTGPRTRDRSYRTTLYGDDVRWLMCFQNTDKSDERAGGRVFPDVELVNPEDFAIAGIGLWTDWTKQAILSRCVLMTDEARTKLGFNSLPKPGEDCSSELMSELVKLWSDLWRGYQVQNMLDL